MWTDLANVFGIPNGVLRYVVRHPNVPNSGTRCWSRSRVPSEVKPMLSQQDLAEFAEQDKSDPRAGYVGMIRGLLVLFLALQSDLKDH